MEQSGANGSERVLRDAVLAGDAAAWRVLYAAHFDRLAAYARWRCGGLADLTDDVIQEMWLTAVRRLQKFDPARGPFAAWLAGVAANAARNAVRSRRRRGKRARPLDEADAVTCGEDRAAAAKAERVAVALAELPEHYEAVLRAKYLDAMTVEQIARERGDSPKAVESLLT